MSSSDLKKRIENITNELNLEFNSKKNTDCKEVYKKF
jgi:hypothetical protein